MGSARRTPEAIHGLCHGSSRRIAMSTVGLDRQHHPAVLLDLGGKRLRAILRCGIAESDVRAIARQPAYDRGADTAPPAGDVGDLDGQYVT
jgi:hypothetical protein